MPTPFDKPIYETQLFLSDLKYSRTEAISPLRNGWSWIFKSCQDKSGGF
jgi:hypothetical protein